MKMQQVILGVKQFKGEIDGKFHDTCKVFVLNDLDTSQGTALGGSVSEYKFGTSDNFARFRGLSFPFLADMDATVTLSGQKNIFTIHDFKPVTSKDPLNLAGS